MVKQTMILTSPDFEPHGIIPDRFTCEGQNINPTLQFSQIPQGTKSLALIVDDADAIRPEGPFVHWLIWNLDGNIGTLGENTIPPGAAEGKNSQGNSGWTGPCPPGSQPHHYRFMAFALNDRLNLAPGSTKLEVEKAMKDKILAQGDLIGEYRRVTIG